MDVLCQAKSGMGKTAVFVLATLNQLKTTETGVQVIVLCHARELAYQIGNEYNRFSKCVAPRRAVPSRAIRLPPTATAHHHHHHYHFPHHDHDDAAGTCPA